MLAKQTIPNTVIVTRGVSQVHFGYSSLQGRGDMGVLLEERAEEQVNIIYTPGHRTLCYVKMLHSASASPLFMLLNITL